MDIKIVLTDEKGSYDVDFSDYETAIEFLVSHQEHYDSVDEETKQLAEEGLTEL